MKRELSLDEIKKIELNLLIEFREICNKLGLRYYIFGGTLLGAIRHKGFIPWDDDIDVCMPRPDYNKLIEFVKSSYRSESNKFIFSTNDCEYLHFMRFVNTKTHLVNKYHDYELNRHIWIDIMPIDGLPKDDNELSKIYKKANFYRQIILLTTAKLGQGSTFSKKILKCIFKPIALLYTRKKAVENLNKLAMKYNYESSEYVGAVSMGLYGISERILKSDIGMGCEVEFEKEKFNTFCCWDSYLKSLYKDYMQLPPIEKRKSHNFMALLDEQRI